MYLSTEGIGMNKAESEESKIKKKAIHSATEDQTGTKRKN